MKKFFLLSLILSLASGGLAQAEHSIVPQVAVVATERGSSRETTKLTQEAPTTPGLTAKQVASIVAAQLSAFERRQAEKETARAEKDSLRTVVVDSTLNVISDAVNNTPSKQDFETLNDKVDTLTKKDGVLDQILARVSGLSATLWWVISGIIFLIISAILILFGVWVDIPKIDPKKFIPRRNVQQGQNS